MSRKEASDKYLHYWRWPLRNGDDLIIRGSIRQMIDLLNFTPDMIKDLRCIHHGADETQADIFLHGRSWQPRYRRKA